METGIATQKLSALAHAGRLEVFRCLVRAGAEGLAAGDVAVTLGVQPNTLSAQLNILSAADLVKHHRVGRSIVYRADLQTLNELVLYLIEDCCERRDEVCAPILEALQATNC